VSDLVRVDLTLVEYFAGQAHFESDNPDHRLTLPLADWDALGRPSDIRLTVEANQ